jgi:putative membrane protein
MWGWNGTMPWMAFWPLVFLVVCVVMMALMMGGGMHMGRRRKDDALDILRERFARGEIDQHEYEDRKRLLS